MPSNWAKRYAAMRRNRGLPDYSEGTYYGGAGLPSVSREGQTARGIGSAMQSAAGPTSMVMPAVGLGLEVVGAGINAYQDAKAEKRRQMEVDREWNMTKRMMLQELAEKKDKKDWDRRFARRLGGM